MRLASWLVASVVLASMAHRSAWAQPRVPSPSAASAGSTPPKMQGPGESVSWAIEGGGTVSLSLPAGATAMPDDQLARPDLSGVAGATIALRRGAAANGDRASQGVQVVCARAPGAGAALAAAGEAVVFDRLDDVARADLARRGQVDAFSQATVRDESLTTVGGFTAEGRATSPPGRLHAEGRYVLGVVGEGHDVLVCAVTCVEVGGDAPGRCHERVVAARVDAPFVAPPQPSLVARLLASCARRPGWALGLLVGLAATLSGLLIAAWPGPRASAGPGGAGAPAGAGGRGEAKG